MLIMQKHGNYARFVCCQHDSHWLTAACGDARLHWCTANRTTTVPNVSSLVKNFTAVHAGRRHSL